MRCERQAVRASRGDDEPIGRITVERHRQIAERDHHFDVERNDLDHTDRCGFPYPNVEGSIEREPAFGVQHLRFPEADRRQAYGPAQPQTIQRGTLLCRELRRPQEPP